MSLKWVEKPVDTPYGPVPTLHRAVVKDHEEDLRTVNLPEQHSDVEDQLEEELEVSADLLGSVLWNSNSTALYYLHEHVFQLPLSPLMAPHNTSGTPSYGYTGPPAPLRGLRVVELGAGVGVLGVALAMAGAQVVITDIPELLPLMQRNVALNADHIASRSQGLGRCTAVGWKWGPSHSMNVKKILQKASVGVKASTGGASSTTSHTKHQTKAVQETTTTSSVGEAAALVEQLFGRLASCPSHAWTEVQRMLSIPQASGSSPTPTGKRARGDDTAVDYVVLCDALYGNPKDWPALLFTLSEILRHSVQQRSTPTVILNFCEQRVHEVEGAFLELLDEENKRTPLWSNRCTEEAPPEWGSLVEAVRQHTTTSPPPKKTYSSRAPTTEPLTSSSSTHATLASSSTPPSPLPLSEAPRVLMSRLLSEMRGDYRWVYEVHYLEADANCSQQVSSSNAPTRRMVSDLQMPIRVARITWEMQTGVTGCSPGAARKKETLMEGGTPAQQSAATHKRARAE